MPRILKIIYLGAATLALIAFGLGVYEYVFTSDRGAHFGSDVFLPFAVLVIVIALYVRRKNEFESGQRRRAGRSRENT